MYLKNVELEEMLTPSVISWPHWFLCNKERTKNPKTWWKLMKTRREQKMWLMIILKVKKPQRFPLSLEDTFFEKPQGWSNWLYRPPPPPPPQHPHPTQKQKKDEKTWSIQQNQSWTNPVTQSIKCTWFF